MDTFTLGLAVPIEDGQGENEGRRRAHELLEIMMQQFGATIATEALELQPAGVRLVAEQRLCCFTVAMPTSGGGTLIDGLAAQAQALFLSTTQRWKTGRDDLARETGAWASEWAQRHGGGKVSVTTQQLAHRFTAVFALVLA